MDTGVILAAMGFVAVALSGAAILFVRRALSNATSSDHQARLAVAEEKASRAGALEAQLSESIAKFDLLRGEKEGLSVELATSSEALKQIKEAMLRTTEQSEREEANNRELRRQLEALGVEKASAEQLLAEKTARLEERERAYLMLQATLDEVTASLDQSRAAHEKLSIEHAALKESLEQNSKQADEKLSLLQEAKQEMANQFKVLSDEIMKGHALSLSKQNKENIDAVLVPLRDRINEFNQNLQLAHQETTKERATLAEQIRSLGQTSAQMAQEAVNLTRALKSESQTQGAWGEMILSHILERSGLREGEEFVTQQSHATDDGGRLRPDVLVNLPNGQRIVIDSKVSLRAFEAYVNGVTEEERALALANHLASVRTHVRTLAGKEYQRITEAGLDYVVMFVPIEGALSAAVQADADLTGWAMEQHVAIASPINLMTILRTVAHVWNAERRNRNADAIADRAGKLFDKFVGFIGDMQELGKRLGAAQDCHLDAMKKLSTSPGNLVRQAEQLKQMGAKSTKSLPSELLDASDMRALPVGAIPVSDGS